MKEVKMLVVHERPHFDEILAIWLLKKFGKEKYPGIEQAKVAFFNPEDPRCDAKSAEDIGALMVGIGKGRLDEHPAIGKERKNGECAATLAAKDLGIAGEPALERLLKFATDNDLKATGTPFDIAYIPKILFRLWPDSPEKVIQWVVIGIEAKYQEQLDFVTTTKKEFEENAKVEEVQGPNGKTLKLVAVKSDNEQMNKYARSRAISAAVVVQQQTSGNVQIYTNKFFGVTLYDVASIIRFQEQEAKGEIIETDWKRLSSEGMLAGWYFHEQGQMLLNGSLTAKVSPTQLSLDKIAGIVKIGINPNLFEPAKAQKCRKGICSSTKDHPCSWYPWGLQRCRKIRYESKK